MTTDFNWASIHGPEKALGYLDQWYSEKDGSGLGCLAASLAIVLLAVLLVLHLGWN